MLSRSMPRDKLDDQTILVVIMNGTIRKNSTFYRTYASQIDTMLILGDLKQGNEFLVITPQGQSHID